MRTDFDTIREALQCSNPHCIGGAYPTIPDGEPEQCRVCWENREALTALDRIQAQNEAGAPPSPSLASKSTASVEPEQTRVWNEVVDKLELKDLIKACCDLTMMGVLTDVGLREDKSWGHDKESLLDKLMEVSRIQPSQELIQAGDAMYDELVSHFAPDGKLNLKRSLDLTAAWDRAKQSCPSQPASTETKAATGN